MNKKLILFVILLVVLMAGVVVFFYYRNAVFSKEILKLEVLGPQHAKAGEEITYTITYKNNGNFALEKPKLIFELPDHSLTEDNKVRFAQNLQDIYPGQEGSLTFQARLLGKEDEVKTAHAWLSYMPHNLSVRYESDTTLSTKIDAVPITLTYDMPSKVEGGKTITYSINYFSNIDYPLENLSVKADLANGFNFQSSAPVSLDPAEYKLPVLEKGQGGRITINGSLNAAAGNSLTFGARLGMWIDGVFIVIKETTQDVEIIPSTMSPVLTLSQTVDQPVDGTYMVHWRVKNDVNNVKNVKVKATLPLSVTLGDDIVPESELARFSWDSASRQIVWSVGDLAPGAQADLAFGVALIPGGEILIQAMVFGEDQFTGAIIKNNASTQ